jgi:hypothetical protein
MYVDNKTKDSSKRIHFMSLFIRLSYFIFLARLTKGIWNNTPQFIYFLQACSSVYTHQHFSICMYIVFVIGFFVFIGASDCSLIFIYVYINYTSTIQLCKIYNS